VAWRPAGRRVRPWSGSSPDPREPGRGRPGGSRSPTAPAEHWRPPAARRVLRPLHIHPDALDPVGLELGGVGGPFRGGRVAALTGPPGQVAPQPAAGPADGDPQRRVRRAELDRLLEPDGHPAAADLPRATEGPALGQGKRRNRVALEL